MYIFQHTLLIALVRTPRFCYHVEWPTNAFCIFVPILWPKDDDDVVVAVVAIYVQLTHTHTLIQSLFMRNTYTNKNPIQHGNKTFQSNTKRSIKLNFMLHNAKHKFTYSKHILYTMSSSSSSSSTVALLAPTKLRNAVMWINLFHVIWRWNLLSLVNKMNAYHFSLIFFFSFWYCFGENGRWARNCNTIRQNYEQNDLIDMKLNCVCFCVYSVAIGITELTNWWD